MPIVKNFQSLFAKISKDKLKLWFLFCSKFTKLPQKNETQNLSLLFYKKVGCGQLSDSIAFK